MQDHPAVRVRTLAELHQTIAGCRMCPRMLPPPILWAREGQRALVIGQAPGITEPVRKLPFAGAAGRKLVTWLAPLGITSHEEMLERFAFAAVAKCYPGRVPGGRGDRAPDRAVDPVAFEVPRAEHGGAARAHHPLGGRDGLFAVVAAGAVEGEHRLAVAEGEPCGPDEGTQWKRGLGGAGRGQARAQRLCRQSRHVQHFIGGALTGGGDAPPGSLADNRGDRGGERQQEYGHGHGRREVASHTGILAARDPVRLAPSG